MELNRETNFFYFWFWVSLFSFFSSCVPHFTVWLFLHILRTVVSFLLLLFATAQFLKCSRNIFLEWTWLSLFHTFCLSYPNFLLLCNPPPSQSVDLSLHFEFPHHLVKFSLWVSFLLTTHSDFFLFYLSFCYLSLSVFNLYFLAQISHVVSLSLSLSLFLSLFIFGLSTSSCPSFQEFFSLIISPSFSLSIFDSLSLSLSLDFSLVHSLILSLFFFNHSLFFLIISIFLSSSLFLPFF